jgi:uncharacterized membrane protein
MPKNRLEAFSDGVIAIVITLLVLEIHVPNLPPHADGFAMAQALWKLAPSIAAYVISFLICSIWWITHHNFVHDLREVDRTLLWANNVFLLFLAFMPFPTALLGQHPGESVAAALYGADCTLTGACFVFMRWYASFRGRLMRPEIPSYQLERRVKGGVVSPLLYLAATLISFISPATAIILYLALPVWYALGQPGLRTQVRVEQTEHEEEG